MAGKRRMTTEVSRLCIRALPWTLPVGLLGTFLGYFFWYLGYALCGPAPSLSYLGAVERLLADVFLPGIKIAEWLSFDVYTTRVLDWVAFLVAQLVYYYLWTVFILFWRWQPRTE